MARGSAGIILVSHVTNAARQAHLDSSAWASGKRCFAHSSSPSRFWAFLAGYVLVTRELGTFVRLAFSHWSNPSASWTLGFVGVAKRGTPVCEG